MCGGNFRMADCCVAKALTICTCGKNGLYVCVVAKVPFVSSVNISEHLHSRNHSLDQGSSTFFSPRTPWLRDTEQGPPPPPPQIWARYSYNLFGTKRQTHTHTHTHTHRHTPPRTHT